MYVRRLYVPRFRRKEKLVNDFYVKYFSIKMPGFFLLFSYLSVYFVRSYIYFFIVRIKYDEEGKGSKESITKFPFLFFFSPTRPTKDTGDFFKERKEKKVE